MRRRALKWGDKMPFIKVEVTISKRLGYGLMRHAFVVGSNKGSVITKPIAIEVMKGIVKVFRTFNKSFSGGENEKV